MAIDFTEDFSGGTHGATITTSNTAFSAVLGSPTFDSATMVAGLAAKFPGGGSMSVQESFTATSQRYFRRYFRMTGNPSANTIIAHARSGTAARVQIRVLTTGKLQLRNGVIAVGADSTITLAADTWYRLEWKLDGAASTQTLRIFHGANLHGTVPDEEMERLYDTGTADNIIDGQITAATWVTYEDQFASDPTTWPGPATPLLENTFEGGTAGSVITTGGTGSGHPWDTVSTGSSGSLIWDDTRSAHGTLSAKASTTASESAYVLWSSFAETTVYCRLYIYLTEVPTENTNIVRFISSTGSLFAVGSIRIGADGKIGYFRGTTFIGSSTAAITLNRWIRIEARYTASTTAGSATVRIYDNADRDSTTLTQEMSVSNVDTDTPPIDQMRVGIVSNGTFAAGFWFDDVALGAADWIGPSTASLPPSGAVTITASGIASGETFGTASLGHTIDLTSGGAGEPATLAATTLASGDRSANQQATTGTTATISPAANSALVVVIGTNYSLLAGVAGLGLTWTEAVSTASFFDEVIGLHAYTAVCGPTPGSGALTITNTAGQFPYPMRYVILEITGAASTGATLQGTVYADSSGGALFDLTQNAPAHASNRPVSAWYVDDNWTWTPRANWTELSESTTNPTLQTQWRSDAFDTTASAGGGDQGPSWAAIAFELAAGAGTETSAGIPSAEAFGVPALTQHLAPAGVATAEASGVPALTQHLAPAGIATAETHGPAIVTSAAEVGPSSVASAEAFGGTARITITVTATAIGSAEALGTPTVTPLWAISPTAVTTAEAHGTLTVAAGEVILIPAAVPTGETFGSPVVATDEVTIAPPGIAPGEFGSATLATGLVTLYPASAASAEALGVAAVARPIAELADDFTGPDIDLTRWALAGV